MNLIQTQARRVFKGVSWRDPGVSFVLALLNPVDSIVRTANGFAYLPKYSDRVRSSGIVGEFGGRKFAHQGQYIRELLQEYVQLVPDSRVLEIGCGCGRVPLALSDLLKDGHYTGVDIDEVSVKACWENKHLQAKGFHFDLIELHNGVYNPEAEQTDETYTFSYPSESFDIIFLFSVFTHMLPAGVANYQKEIARMLVPGGRCLFSTFLMDYGREGKDISFPFEYDNYYVFRDEIPEKAVGYQVQFFDDGFDAWGMKRVGEPLLGPWRPAMDDVTFSTSYPQDILVFEKMK